MDQAFLSWASSQPTDGPSCMSQMTEAERLERLAWLRKAMDNTAIDLNEVMATALQIFASPAETLDDRITASETLQGIVEMPCFSQNLRNYDGWNTIVGLLNDTSAEIVAAAASLIGGACFNNAEGCKAAITALVAAPCTLPALPPGRALRIVSALLSAAKTEDLVQMSRSFDLRCFLTRLCTDCHPATLPRLVATIDTLAYRASEEAGLSCYLPDEVAINNVLKVAEEAEHDVAGVRETLLRNRY